MALADTETWRSGFLVDASGALIVTTNKTGAVVWGGFLRDADGRLVVT